MRYLVLIVGLLAGPAQAWTFSASPVCTLSHSEAELDVVVTYDPRKQAPYAISATGSNPWPDEPVFGIEFRGGRTLTITTPEHGLSQGGRTLTVTDRGFGNVLTGLEFNSVASFFTGNARKDVSLVGAAGPVQEFRACTTQPSA